LIRLYTRREYQWFSVSSKKEESSISDWWSGACLKGLTYQGTCGNARRSIEEEERINDWFQTMIKN
jgi:hypothetical protein